MLQNKKWMIGLVIFLAVAAMTSYIRFFREGEPPDTGLENAQEYILKRMAIEEELSTSATIVSKYSQQLKAGFNSETIDLKVAIGDEVIEGDVLAILDTGNIELQILTREKHIEDLEAQIDQLKREGKTRLATALVNAKATYENYKVTYEKNLKLYEAGAISRNELDGSKLSMDRAYNDYILNQSNYASFDFEGEIELIRNQIEIERENVEQLDLEKSEATIRAPFNGVVTNIFVDDNQAVNPEEPIVEIMDLSQLEAEAEISEYEIVKVKIGQTVVISTLGDRKKTYEGAVSMIYPSGIVEGSEVYVLVIVDITNPDEGLKPGFSCTLDILLSGSENALVVPYDALKRINDDYFVSKLNEDGSITDVEVETGIESNLMIEVISDDLEEGDVVLVMSEIKIEIHQPEGPFQEEAPGRPSGGKNGNGGK